MSPRLVEIEKALETGPNEPEKITFWGNFKPIWRWEFDKEGQIEKISFPLSGKMVVDIISNSETLRLLRDNGKGDKELVRLLSGVVEKLKRLVEGKSKNNIKSSASLKLEFSLVEDGVRGMDEYGLLFTTPKKAIEAIKTILGHSDLSLSTGNSQERTEIIEAISETIEVLQESL